MSNENKLIASLRSALASAARIVASATPSVAQESSRAEPEAPAPRGEIADLLREYMAGGDIPNNADPRNGVIDIPRVRAAFEVDPAAALAFLNAAVAGKKNGSRAALLLLAAIGSRRGDIEIDAKALHQIQIKAFGALPLAPGETPRDRYDALQSIHDAARKFANKRRNNIQAAVQVALANLAQVAGYADAAALEDHMQASIFTLDQTEWQIGDYTLALDPVTAGLSATKSGKPLKTIPAAVRKDALHETVKSLSQALRRQITRVRRDILEAHMASGAAFDAEAFAKLWAFPAARPMTTALVWINADGANGLLSSDGTSLTGLDSRIYPAEAPLRLAHPFDLYEQDTLALWQKHIVHHKLVQPFKQVFRELYIVTPAELATATYSNRFANHSVAGATAARLFASRGWVIEHADGYIAVPTKTVDGVRAVFAFEDAYHFFGGHAITSGRILFTHAGERLKWDWQNRMFSTKAIPIEDIAPLFFSEIMRDADLVTAVAQSGEGGGQISAESYAARGAVVSTLIEDLGLPGVRVEGHFAHIAGKRAKYRVHLGNAAIHIDPGNYLCIVPDRAYKSAETLYLPFAEDGDRKVSEVISKIMLLLNDDKITDPSILRQLPKS
jgi:hypothetical protein